LVRTTQTSGWFPHRFIKFDKTLQRKRKAYANPGDRANQSKIDSEIADIHNIMKRNIDEVLNRGERLDHLVESTSTLKHEAAKYKWGAKKFHAMAVWQQYAPFVAVGACCLFVAWLKLR
jgi:vesicle transport protein SEC22